MPRITDWKTYNLPWKIQYAVHGSAQSYCVFRRQILESCCVSISANDTGKFDEKSGVERKNCTSHSVKKTLVQKLQNNEVFPPTQLLTTPVTRTSNPFTIIQHCPKVTTSKSVALSTHPAGQRGPLLFPQLTTHYPCMHPRSITGCQSSLSLSNNSCCVLLSRFTSTKVESLTKGIILLLQDESPRSNVSLTCCSCCFGVG